MTKHAPIAAEPVSPVDGLHHFVAAWREAVLSQNTELDLSKQSFVSRIKRTVRPPLQQETKDRFVTVLDAMDRYLTEEVAPRYATQPDMRTKLDAYWHDRSDMYNPHTHLLPTTKNGLSVGRSYMDMMLDFLQIGAGTESFIAVRDASDAFKEHIYGKSFCSSHAR